MKLFRDLEDLKKRLFEEIPQTKLTGPILNDENSTPLGSITKELSGALKYTPIHNNKSETEDK